MLACHPCLLFVKIAWKYIDILVRVQFRLNISYILTIKRILWVHKAIFLEYYLMMGFSTDDKPLGTFESKFCQSAFVTLLLLIRRQKLNLSMPCNVVQVWKDEKRTAQIINLSWMRTLHPRLIWLMIVFISFLLSGIIISGSVRGNYDWGISSIQLGNAIAPWNFGDDYKQTVTQLFKK